MSKVAREVAINDVNRWLDYKVVSERKRESLKDSIETLVDAVEDGLLIVNDDHTIIQNLRIVPDGEEPIKSLTYKPRLKVSEVHMQLANVKSTDADGRVCAYIAALTTKPKGIIRALDTEDYGIGQAIAIFFL
jgi:hypothetical protein